jgi:hypothetical protein
MSGVRERGCSAHTAIMCGEARRPEGGGGWGEREMGGERGSQKARTKGRQSSSSAATKTQQRLSASK